MKKNLELIQLEVCHRRKALLSPYMENRHKYGSRGFEGEDEAVSWIVLYGNDNWFIVTDYWFSKGTANQTDIMIISRGLWKVVEVKNYDGHFNYKKDACYLNDFQLADNPMTSMSTKLQKLRQITKELPFKVKVEGVMVFINEHSSLDLDRTFPFEVLTRNQFRKYVADLKGKANQPMSRWELMKVNHLLEKYQILSPFGPHKLEIETFEMLPKGITCWQCHSFNIRIDYKSVYCKNCKARESKKKAIIRTAYDLRYLYYYQTEIVTSQRLFDFMGGVISKQSIRKVMKSNFKTQGYGMSRYYQVEVEKWK